MLQFPDPCRQTPAICAMTRGSSICSSVAFPLHHIPSKTHRSNDIAPHMLSGLFSQNSLVFPLSLMPPRTLNIVGCRKPICKPLPLGAGSCAEAGCTVPLLTLTDGEVITTFNSARSLAHFSECNCCHDSQKCSVCPTMNASTNRKDPSNLSEVFNAVFRTWPQPAVSYV